MEYHMPRAVLDSEGSKMNDPIFRCRKLRKLYYSGCQEDRVPNPARKGVVGSAM